MHRLHSLYIQGADVVTTACGAGAARRHRQRDERRRSPRSSGTPTAAVSGKAHNLHSGAPAESDAAAHRRRRGATGAAAATAMGHGHGALSLQPQAAQAAAVTAAAAPPAATVISGRRRRNRPARATAAARRPARLQAFRYYSHTSQLTHHSSCGDPPGGPCPSASPASEKPHAHWPRWMHGAAVLANIPRVSKTDQVLPATVTCMCCMTSRCVDVLAGSLVFRNLPHRRMCVGSVQTSCVCYI